MELKICIVYGSDHLMQNTLYIISLEIGKF